MAIPQVGVLPNETLLVSFDMTNGEGNEICLVGREDGKTITIINAFQGAQVRDIFRLLTVVKSDGGTETDERAEVRTGSSEDI